MKIAAFLIGLIRTAAEPSAQAGIMAVPGTRMLLIFALMALVFGVLLAMRLQFSRFEQRIAIRLSATACFIAVLVFGLAAIAYGEASL